MKREIQDFRPYCGRLFVSLGSFLQAAKRALIFCLVATPALLLAPSAAAQASMNTGIFQFAIFYNDLLEFSTCQSMTVNGWVHANGSIYTGPGGANSTLVFNSTVTTAGILACPANNGHVAWTFPGGTFNGNPGYVTNMSPILPILLLFTTNLHALIDQPPAGEDQNSAVGSQRLYNQANIVLQVSNTTARVVIRDSTAANDPAPIVLTYTNLSSSYLATNGLPWLVTNSFTDRRENSKVMSTAQIDVGKFGQWLTNNSSVAAKYPAGSGSYPDILYVANNKSYTASTLAAVRLTNGIVCPTNGGYGFTVATFNPLYVWGHYNCPNSAALGTTDTSATVPCAIMADALTILSGNWRDTNSSKTTPPGAANDTINSAILVGTVPSTGTTSTTFSGGVHNLPRLLEDWTGNTLTLNTSLVNLFASQIATNKFQNPSYYYIPPTRQFSFDQNFADPTRLPPGTPSLLGYGPPIGPPMIFTQPQSQTVSSGNIAVFSVMATGSRPLSYQWSLKGTNLDGATNYNLFLPNVQLNQAGNYAVLVTNALGSITSSNAVLTVLESPPRISIQPTNQTVYVGNTVAFKVAASGSMPLSYQWNLNETNIIDGATNTSLTLTNVQLSQAGNYAVQVTNAFGSMLSSNAVLTVNGKPPTISTEPTNQTVYVGETAVYTVLAGGMPPFSYQWSFNETNIIDGATNASLTLTNAQFSQAGNYAVQVTNAFGLTNSSNAKLTVNSPPPCVAPPTGLVSWWRAEGNALDDGRGNDGTLAGNATYGAGYVGQGFVLDGNTDAVLVGNPANLQLQDLTIEAWIRRTSASLVSAGGGNGNGMIFAYGHGGYGLYLNSSGHPALSRIDIDNVTLNSVGITDTNFHHLAVTKTGSTVVFYIDGVAYTVGAFNPGFVFTTDAAIGAWGPSLNNSFLGTIDEVSIYNRALATNEVQAIYNAGVSGKCAVPAITMQPTNQTVLVDGMAVFAVAAGGTPPLSYQWSLNGTNLDGATNTSLTLTNVQLSQAGNYAVTVTNMLGSITSSNAVLTVNGLPPTISTQPTDQSVLVGGTAAFTVAANGTPPLSCQWSWNGTNVNGATNTSLTLTNVQLSQAGNYAVLVTNAFGSISSSNAVLTVNPPPPCVMPPSGLVSWWPGEGNANDIVGANSGTPVGNVTYGAGEVGQGFIFDGLGDAVAVGNPASLQLQNFTIEAWVRRASATMVSHFESDSGVGMIFSYGYGGYGLFLDTGGHPTLSQVGITNVTAAGSITDTNFHHLAVTKDASTVVFFIDGTAYPVGDFNPAFCFTNAAQIGAEGDAVENVFLGTIDEVSVYNCALTTNDIQAVYNASASGKCLTPAITSPPTNQTAVVGGTTTFMVGASGAQPLGYQWSLNETNLDGATNTSLTLTNVQLEQAGGYVVVVSNNWGSATSAVATLTVLVPPSIITQPANQTVLQGSNATFSVVAGGTLPLNYQWQFFCTNLVDATNPTLLLTGVTTNQSGAYSITITNVAGTATSSNAVLSVYASAAAMMGSAACTNNSQFQFDVNGVPGFNYAIEATTNFVNWVPLLTNTSPFPFVDTNGSNLSLRFYRAVWLP